MARNAKAIAFSVTPEIAKEIESMAKREGMSKSELFRAMLKNYKQAKVQDDFLAIQRRISAKLREQGFTEESIESLVLKGR